MTEIRIVVINSHQLVRAGIVHTLSVEPDLIVVGEGASTEDARQLNRRHKPHILLLGVSVLKNSMAELAGVIEDDPTVKVIMLTGCADDARVGPAMQLGAWGYLLDQIEVPELTSSVRLIHRGQKYVAPAIAAHLFSNPRASEKPARDCFSALSSREEQILNLLVEGLSNKEIGGRLRISEKTVKHYLTIVLEKLNAKNRVQAALLAYGRAKLQEKWVA